MSTLTLRNVKGTPLTNTEVDDNFSNLNNDKLEKDGSNSMTGKLTTVTSSASTASVRVVAGSADPTSPVSGDVWNNAGDFKYYTGSATRVLATVDGAQTLSNKTLDAAIVTNGLYFEGATADIYETLLTVVDPTGDRIVTIPDATTTMVGTDVTQTLTNKSINLANNTLTTTSAQLATAISDETGTGLVVFNGSPTITTPTINQINTEAATNFTLDSAADIILDADGADIILRDGGTEFGRFTQSGGQLVIASSSGGTTALTMSGSDVSVNGDLTVNGNDIKASGGTTAITLNSADVTVAGDLQVTGNDIKSSTGAVAISLSGSAVTIAGDLVVNGTTTTVNSTTLDVDDVNITVAKGNATNAGADGAGITVEATTAGNKTWTYSNGSSSWNSSEHINIPTGKNYLINGSQIAASNLSNGTTGSGSVVLATSPTLTTPTIGAASATSVNKVTITEPATSATLSLANGSTLATGGAFSTTLTATAATNVTLPTTGTLATLAGSETLTNKSISGASNTLSNIANASLTNSTISGISLGGTLATLTMNTSGTGLSGSTTYNGSGAATFTVASNATNLNTASTIVARDGSGNFTAGTITAALSGNATTATTLATARNIQGVSFNGSADITVVTAGTGITVSGTQVSIPQAVGTTSGVQFGSFGVGTAASGTTGEIRATNEITAYYSDARLKNFHGTIENALEKVQSLNGYYFTENELAKSLGYNNDAMQIGLSAQEVEAVLPQAIAPAPIDPQYMAVKYEKLVPMLVEAIKELKAELDEVKKNCTCNK